MIQSGDIITENKFIKKLYEINAIVHTRFFSNLDTYDYDVLSESNVSIICLSAYCLIRVMKDIASKINKYILVLVEADVIRIPQFILDDHNCVHCFQWNKEFSHPKITGIPIGLNHFRQFTSIQKIGARGKTEKKDFLLGANFTLKTHKSRKKLYNITKQWGFCNEIKKMCPLKRFRKRTFIEEERNRIKIVVTNPLFYEEICKYKFILCPRGEGLDTHRIWECLYIGCIPIVLSSSLNELFQDLPVLIINDWTEINEGLLNRSWDKMQKQNFTFEKTKLSFWINEICSKYKIQI